MPKDEVEQPRQDISVALETDGIGIVAFLGLATLLPG
jgi:hypothetical protein